MRTIGINFIQTKDKMNVEFNWYDPTFGTTYVGACDTDTTALKNELIAKFAHYYNNDLITRQEYNFFLQSVINIINLHERSEHGLNSSN